MDMQLQLFDEDIDTTLICMRCDKTFDVLTLKNNFGVFCNSCFEISRNEAKLAYEFAVAEKKRKSEEYQARRKAKQKNKEI